MSPRWNKSLSIVKGRDYSDLQTCYKLTQNQIDIIDTLVDKDLLEKLGYPTEKPISN